MIYNQINIHSLISANIFCIKKQYQNMSRESQCAPSHESHWCFFQATFVRILYKINYCYHYMFYYLTSIYKNVYFRNIFLYDCNNMVTQSVLRLSPSFILGIIGRKCDNLPTLPTFPRFITDTPTLKNQLSTFLLVIIYLY